MHKDTKCFVSIEILELKWNDQNTNKIYYNAWNNQTMWIISGREQKTYWITFVKRSWRNFLNRFELFVSNQSEEEVVSFSFLYRIQFWTCNNYKSANEFNNIDRKKLPPHSITIKIITKAWAVTTTFYI